MVLARGNSRIVDVPARGPKMFVRHPPKAAPTDARSSSSGFGEYRRELRTRADPESLADGLDWPMTATVPSASQICIWAGIVAACETIPAQIDESM
jgi:hypothetical protein